MKKINRLNYIINVILALFVFATIFVTGGVGGKAYAASVTYSNVIDDLTADKNFNFTDYPEVKDDYSIQVIQIAESEKGYLYLYTYQPCQSTKPLVATYVNMSLSETVDDTKLYELVLVNTWGVFAKYFVRDIKLNLSGTHYYNLSSIYRDWETAIDGETGTNNTGEKKAYPVGKVFKATRENGEIKYSCDPLYTVDIINPYSDYLIYATSASLPSISSIRFNFEKLGMIDGHYIAFSTNLEIDRLKSATVTYSYCSAVGHYNTFLGFDCGGDITYGNELVDYAYPSYDDKFEREGGFLNSGLIYSYTWDRIQTAAEFIATEKNLTDETKTNLSDKQWVLRFLETERTQTETGILGYKKYTTNFTKVDKVAVLRLEFETDGITYNLGTVSDIVSGDEYGGNVEKEESQSIWDKIVEFFKNLWSKITGLDWWKILLIIIAVIVAICIVIAVIKLGIKTLFKLILQLVKYMFIGLWYIVSAPFRLIVLIFKKIKGD